MADPLTVACPDCLAPTLTPCTSPLLQDGEAHPDRQRLADLRNLTHGTCNLCHQPMVYGTVQDNPPDAWHPDPDDAAHCPPMPDPLTDWNAYARAINAGTQAGRPGAEHFRPVESALMEHGRALASQREDLIAAGVAPTDLLMPIAPIGAVCPECSAGKHPNCTTITLDLTLDDYTPCTCTHGTETEADTCPACGLPREVPGEGRYCGTCQDHEGTCAADHCMTCGSPT